ncbi:MAG: ATP-binding protein, partial [Prevotellaceae bacterium]|nr:ATP-binding protein [Prevotellaceae bacterium]
NEYLLDRIRYWYNGYTWDGKTAIYNPFSTLKFFSEQRFDGYWYDTGTPTFLIDIIQRRNSVNAVLEPFVVDSSIFRGYEPTDIDEVPLLFQTGYLTIKQMKLTNGIYSYTLGIPNSEVNDAFLKSLLNAYGKYRVNQIKDLHEKIKQQITACDEAGFSVTLESMVATVPSVLHSLRESYYQSLMLIWMRLIGFEIRGEEPNNLGRSDIVWEQPGMVVVAEIKYHAKTAIDTLLKAAMTQIHEKRYYNKYLGKVLLLCIAFSGKNIGCKMEVLNR